MRVSPFKSYVFGLGFPLVAIFLLGLGARKLYYEDPSDKSILYFIAAVIVAIIIHAVIRCRRKNMVVINMQTRNPRPRVSFPFFSCGSPGHIPIGMLEELYYDYHVFWSRRCLYFVFSDGYRLPLLESQYAPLDRIAHDHWRIASMLGVGYRSNMDWWMEEKRSVQQSLLKYPAHLQVVSGSVAYKALNGTRGRVKGSRKRVPCRYPVPGCAPFRPRRCPPRRGCRPWGWRCCRG